LVAAFLTTGLGVTFLVVPIAMNLVFRN
jgi:hypothetical protein